MNRPTSILAALAAIHFATGASAEEVRSASVAAQTSDFATPAARAALDQRIRLAAEEVCGVNAVAEDMSWGRIKECQGQVRQDIYDKLSAINTSKPIRVSGR